MKNLESANTQIKNEFDLLKLKYENFECNHKKKILELEESKKKFHEIQGNINFYNEISINRQMKLVNNEKDKIELMTIEIDRLKAENKDLMENNMSLREEVKKSVEVKNLKNTNARASKNFGQIEHTEILIKEYKGQMKVNILNRNNN